MKYRYSTCAKVHTKFDRIFDEIFIPSYFFTKVKVKVPRTFKIIFQKSD